MSKSRALLLDRDGVINVDDGYIGTVDRFHFRAGLFSFLKEARSLGYRLAVLTNQSGVARGLFSEADYRTLTAHMLSELRKESIDIDLTLACFTHPDGRAPFARESYWRKPNPGMALEALRFLNCDPIQSAFLGDSERDMQAARQASIGRCLWLSDAKPSDNLGYQMVSDFLEALSFLR